MIPIPCPHFQITITQRSKGQSAVAGAAYRHKTEYPVAVMCKFFGVSRSGYYAFVQRLGKPEKDAALAELIAQQRERSFHIAIVQDINI